MLKKRIIFTLLYDSGNFVLSRNFRLQKVGDVNWLKKNYDFNHISFFIDELIVLDVSRNKRDLIKFSEVLKSLTEFCFLPIAAGGGVTSIDKAKKLLHSGADKIVVNTTLFEKPEFMKVLANEFGQQCIVGSIDIFKQCENEYYVFTSNGSKKLDMFPAHVFKQLSEDIVGELYLNSMERDGTGQGYDFRILELLPEDCSIPVIFAGGVGNSSHLLEGIKDTRVDAVATANLYNFIGNGLQNARLAIMNEKIPLAYWPSPEELKLDVNV